MSKNHLLANQQTQEKKPARLGCYRISPKGFEKAWDAGDDYPWKPNSHPPVICDQHVILKTTVGGKASRGDDLVVFDLDSGRMLHQIPSNAAGSNFPQWQCSHGETPRWLLVEGLVRQAEWRSIRLLLGHPRLLLGDAQWRVSENTATARRLRCLVPRAVAGAGIRLAVWIGH